MAGPLTGIRVVELPAIGPVPFLGMLLADLGASVVRVDRLGSSEPPGLAAAGPSGPLGRGRRSIAMDLRRPGAAEIVLRLAAHSDVLLEGFRPGVAERLGVGPAEALARNSRLVYGRMTGWGQSGPLADRAGHDITYLAVSGLLHGIGSSGGPPVPPANYLADFGGGAMMLAVGLLAAVLHARATGEGQVVDAAMVDGAAYLGTMTRALFSAGAWRDSRAANVLDGGAPNYRCYECADGRYVAVGALEPKFWDVLVSTLGLDESDLGSPYEPADWPALTSLLAETFMTRSRDEWGAIFADSDACVAPVLTLGEAPSYSHNAARSSYVSVGDAVVAGPVPRFSATPGVAGELTAVGASTLTVLSELGYDDDEIEALRSAGVL